jgi:hypothetical protein
MGIGRLLVYPVSSGPYELLILFSFGVVLADTKCLVVKWMENNKAIGLFKFVLEHSGSFMLQLQTINVNLIHNHHCQLPTSLIAINIGSVYTRFHFSQLWSTHN